MGEFLCCCLMAAALEACFRILRILSNTGISERGEVSHAERTHIETKRINNRHVEKKAVDARRDDNLFHTTNFCEGLHRLMYSGYHHGFVVPETPGYEMGWTSHYTNLSWFSEVSFRARDCIVAVYVQHTGSINLRRTTRNLTSHSACTHKPIVTL